VDNLLNLIVLLEGSVLEYYWCLPRGFSITAGSGGSSWTRKDPGAVPPEALERLREMAPLRLPFASPDTSPPLAAGDDAVVERDGGPRG